jgi:hypothetical protein
MTESSRLTQQQPPQSTIYQSGYNVSATQSGLNPPYQAGGNFQIGTTYQGAKGYDVTSSYQSSVGSLQSGYQPTNYQPGTYQQGAYQPTTYQQPPTAYQPYQSTTTSNLYGSSSLYKSGYQPPKSTDGGKK